LLLGCLVIAIASHVAAKSHEISFPLRGASQVSVVVYDAQERMLRELAPGMKLQPGQHHFFWDGLERYGKSAPAGEYEW
jgi:flagellar hook assembly protein FlgD